MLSLARLINGPSDWVSMEAVPSRTNRPGDTDENKTILDPYIILYYIILYYIILYREMILPDVADTGLAVLAVRGVRSAWSTVPDDITNLLLILSFRFCFFVLLSFYIYLYFYLSFFDEIFNIGFGPI